MTDSDLQKLKYPIGRYAKPDPITPEILEERIAIIEAFPKKMAAEVAALSDEQLDTPYRPGGWTIRQVVHHCADSHMNAFVRLKLTLTEDKPTVKPYLEARWAELPDSSLPVELSLKLLEGLHARWAWLLRSLSEEELAMRFVHPEQGRETRLDGLITLYGWHCEHHLAHITGIKREKNW